MKETLEQSRFKLTYWPIVATATVIVIVFAAMSWSLAHPYGIHWDEAEYLNNVHVDLQRLYSGRLLRLGGRLLIGSRGIPPAYRILALPLLALFGFHTTVARLSSLACFCLSTCFTYLAARRVGDQIAGAFAALVFALSPAVITASIFFSTDAPLYLATAAMLYFLFVHWSEPSERTVTWIALGLAMGLGLWSKASFVSVAVPPMVFALIIDFRKHRSISGLLSLCKAGALAGLIGAPWWLLNIRQAISYAKYSRDFVRDSLGQPSLVTWARWLNSVIQCLLGQGVSILIALVVVAFLWKAVVKRERTLSGLQKNAIGACACAALPIVLTQLSGINHLLRHISPAVIPIAIMVGLLADRSGWARSTALLATSSVLLFGQLLMIVYPVIFPNTALLNSLL